jgi:hypothetical protein
MHLGRHDSSVGELIDYIARLDLPLAVVVAGSAVVVAFGINAFLQAASEEISRGLPTVGRWLGRSAVDLAHADEERPWFCPVCRSLNHAGAEMCYRGCTVRVRATGRRDELPEDAGEDSVTGA